MRVIHPTQWGAVAGYIHPVYSDWRSAKAAEADCARVTEGRDRKLTNRNLELC